MKVDWRMLYYGTDDPAVRAWLDQHWPEVEDAIQHAVGTYQHEQEVERNAATPTQNTFIVPKSAEDKVKKIAADLGVNITVSPMPAEDVERDLVANAQAAALQVFGVVGPISPGDRARIREDAAETATRYVRVIVIAPPVEDRVVAVAKDDGGTIDFFNVPFEKPYWNEKTMASVSFDRCDICHKHRLRKKLYVITGKKHGIRIVGGECAAQLDLGRKLKDAMNGFESFVAMLSESEWQEGEGYGVKGSSKGARDPIYLIAVSQAVLESMGFVSNKAAHERNTTSTSDHVKAVIATPDSKQNVKFKDRVRDLIKTGQAKNLRDELLVYADDKKEQKRTAYDKSGYDMIVRLQNSIRDGALRGIPLLVFALSDLKNHQAKKASPKSKVPFWFPAIPFVVKEGRPIEFEGPDSSEYGPDRRWRVVALASTQPIVPKSPDVAQTGRVQIETSVSAGGLAREIVRAMGAYEPPNGIYVSVRVIPQSPAIIQAMERRDYDRAFMDQAIRMARGGFRRLMDDAITMGEPTLDTLKAYEIQEPGFCARIDGKADKQPGPMVKALQTGKLTKAVQKDLDKEVPGVWRCTRKIALQANNYGIPHMYTFARVSDGALLTWRYGSGMALKERSSRETRIDMDEKGRRYDTQLAYLEPGDTVYLRGDYSWPTPTFNPNFELSGQLSGTKWSFTEGAFPDRLLYRDDD